MLLSLNGEEEFFLYLDRETVFCPFFAIDLDAEVGRFLPLIIVFKTVDVT